MVTPAPWLPQLYQRFQRFWDRAVPAAGLALLLWASAGATGTYPSEWRRFLATALFAVGLAWPGAAYVAFTFLVAVPLYSISIYLAAIVLAVLVLTSRWAMDNLGATVLVLVTPALLPVHLEGIIPLLVGLWWGEWAGALSGGLAALWLKLLAGMAGQPLDLARLSGWTPAGTTVIERFSGFNSMQTLLELANPFASSSRGLLLHVLQVLAWALAGYLVGRLARRAWPERRRPWAPLLSAVPAAAALWAGYVLLPHLLDRAETPLANRVDTLLLWLLWPALVAAAVRLFYLYLRRPLFRPVSQPAPRPDAASETTRPPSDREGQKPAFEWKPSGRARRASTGDDDLIMLELD